MSEDDHSTPSCEDDEVGQVERLDDTASKAAAAERIQNQTMHVEAAITEATRRGAFDNLPGAGKPIAGLGGEHDPEWWLKGLVEREQLALVPPAVQLRLDDAALDSELDAVFAEDEARRLVVEFNQRVLAARYGAPSAIPLVTQTRDVESTLAAWHQRLTARRSGPAAVEPPVAPRRRRRWWRRGR